jgi:ribulose-phosphate 3-epimerase
MLAKIRAAMQLINEKDLSIDIEVDGGVNSKNARDIVQAGANILVAGNAVFNGELPTVAENINLLKNVCND